MKKIFLFSLLICCLTFADDIGKLCDLYEKMKIAENNEDYNRALNIQKQIYQFRSEFNIKGDIDCANNSIKDNDAYGGWDGWYGHKPHKREFFYRYGDEYFDGYIDGIIDSKIRRDIRNKLYNDMH